MRSTGHRPFKPPTCRSTRSAWCVHRDVRHGIERAGRPAIRVREVARPRPLCQKPYGENQDGGQRGAAEHVEDAVGRRRCDPCQWPAHTPDKERAPTHAGDVCRARDLPGWQAAGRGVPTAYGTAGTHRSMAVLPSRSRSCPSGSIFGFAGRATASNSSWRAASKPATRCSSRSSRRQHVRAVFSCM